MLFSNIKPSVNPCVLGAPPPFEYLKNEKNLYNEIFFNTKPRIPIMFAATFSST